MQLAKRIEMNALVLAIVTFRVGAPEVARAQSCPAFPFSEPVALAGIDADTDSREDGVPQLATDGNGNWMAVWVSEGPDPGGPLDSIDDIVFSRSSDNGATWDQPLPLDDDAGADAARDDENPQIATDKQGNWVVVWQAEDPAHTDADIMFSVFTDVGANWSSPALLHDTADHQDDDVAPQIITDGVVKWVVVWYSNNDLGGLGTDWDIIYTWTNDINDAAPWRNPAGDFNTAALNQNADDAGENSFDVNPHLTTDGNGNWVAVWMSNNDMGGIGGDFDILYSRGTGVAQGGVDWIEPKPLDPFAGADDNAQDWLPRIVTDGNDWVAVWHSNRDPVDPGGPLDDNDIMFSDGLLFENPADGVDWTPGGPLHLATAKDDSGGDVDPQIATDGNGTWMAVWQFDHPDLDTENDREIAFSRRTSGGSWLKPAVLNRNALVQEGGADKFPQIATDGLGNWLVVWQSDDDRDPGTPFATGDVDILVARLTDCNDNCVPDEDDLAATTSFDCNGNGIPDECDIANCPVEDPSCQDCQPQGDPGHGIPDGCELDANDCDDNQVPDECQPDCDGDTIPDACELPPFGPSADCNTNAVPDECEVPPLCPACADCNNSGIPDECEVPPICPSCPDCDGNGEPDECQANCDSGEDSIPDVCELPPFGTSSDCQGNGTPDECEIADCAGDPSCEDCNGDGVPNECQIPPICPTCPDCNDSGIPDECEVPPICPSCPDCDGNGEPDQCQPNCDQSPEDSIPDVCELPPFGTSNDCQTVTEPGHGIPDECELAECPDNDPSCQDCDQNGTLDECDIAACGDGENFCKDCNGNGVPDGCDIQACTGDPSCDDSNSNGVLDGCERPLPASHPHNRAKNRYISFNPVKEVNDGKNVAFTVELTAITLGSCSGNGGFCRTDRDPPTLDCNECSVEGNPCINEPIDCAPDPPQQCLATGQTCENDAPDAGGTSTNEVWWVGPESPAGNGVHLMVSQSFRKVSTDWPNPVHVGDCEIAPYAVYVVRVIDVDAGGDPPLEGLRVTTTLHPRISDSWWGDCVGPLKKFCGGDIRGMCDGTGNLCVRDDECPTGQACVFGRCGGAGITCALDTDCAPSVACEYVNGCSSDADCAPPETTCDLAWTLPDRAVNFDDIGAAVALVAESPTSILPHVTWVDLHGADSGTPGSHNFDPPNYQANFSDIAQIVFAFQGRPYTFYDPADCPDEPCWPGCNNGEVVAPEECDGGIGCTCCTCDPGFEKDDPIALDCVPLGACCDGGNCTEETEASCTTGERIYQGDGTDCTSNPCP